jgi:hypothetical protein
MRLLFFGLVESSAVSAGSVVMWPEDGKGKPCYALKIAPHRSDNGAAAFQEDLLILTPSLEFSVGQLLYRDPRSRVPMLQDAAIAPVLDRGAVELSASGISKPGDLEIWPDRICMRALAANGEQDNPLVDLGSGEILAVDARELPQRDEVRFPAIVRHWELVRQAVGGTDKEILYRKG